MERREFLAGTLGAIGASALGMTTSTTESSAPPRPRAGKNVSALRSKPLERIRYGFIGVGARGPGHLGDAMLLENVEIAAICDIHKPSLDAAVKQVTDKGRSAPATYGSHKDDYKRMLERDDIDAVYIATPWEDHARMAIDTMNSGKHALVEVPMAVTTQEMWDMVDASERNQKHCMMLENVCYGREELLALHLCRTGVLGELLHGEAAYIHDLRWQMNEIEHGTGSWRTLHYTKRNGNLYPTHGLGPVAQYMNINRGDRFDYMTSMSSPARARAIFAKTHYPEGHIRRKHKFVCGDINTTIIKTALGKTLMVQWDEQLPRPYTRHNLIQGTKGVLAGFPTRIVIEDETPSTDSWVQGGDMAKIYEKYEHPLWKKMGEMAQKYGGHGGMDFIMNWRVAQCLMAGEPLDQDVYDGAAWSVIAPLSEWSVANRGQSIDVPDFTRGDWKKMKPLGIVS